MVRKISVTDTIKKSFQVFFKKPLLLMSFYLPIVLAIISFLFALGILISDALIYNKYLIVLVVYLMIFSFWLVTIGIGGMILSAERIIRRKNVKFLEIFNQSIRNSLRLSVAYLLEQIFLVLGLLLLIIPGVFLAVRLTLITPGCILEKKGLGIKRSWNATKGNFWKIFFILLIWNGVFLILGFLPFLVFINILLLPVYLTTLTLLYIQLRKR